MWPFFTERPHRDDLRWLRAWEKCFSPSEMVWRSFGRKAVGMESGGSGSCDGTDDWRSAAERQQFPARWPECAAEHYGPAGVWITDVRDADEWIRKHLRGQRLAAECARRAQRDFRPGRRY